MKIIVGLGNPGKEYEKTRHNAGFIFVDELAKHKELSPLAGRLSFSFDKKFEAEIAETVKDGEKLIIAKPQTYMNLSGQVVRELVDYYKINSEDLIVVSDDVDLPIGYARIRQEGSSGGQKGLQNIIDTLGVDQFTRIRIGINSYEGNINQFERRENKIETKDFVLSKFADREVEILNKIITETISYLIPFLGEKDSRIPSHTLQVI